MATGAELVAVAVTQTGDPYRLGAEAGLHDPDPPAFDCSELVEWACARVGVHIPDGTVNQFPWRIPISVDEAVNTPGALLFIWRGPGFGGGAGNHVAISRGDGTTIEARGRRWGVGSWPVKGRGWTHGGLIPGIDYTRTPTPAPTSSASTNLNRVLEMTGMFQWNVEDGNTYLWDGEKVCAMSGLGKISWRLAEKNIAPNPLEWGEALTIDEHTLLAATLSGSDPSRAWG